MSLLPDRYRTILASRPRKVINERGRIAAAVLLLLYERSGETCILLTKRTDKVADHKGQISFPGGVREITDQSLIATALREAFEEVGIDRKTVEVLGVLDDCRTISTHYVITPVVGYAPCPPHISISPDEVEEVIEIPLGFFKKAAQQTSVPQLTVVPPGDLEFLYEGYVIWGATARILEQFLSLDEPNA